MDLLDAGQKFKVADVEVHLRAHRSQHGHARARGTVYLEAHLHQVFNHLLNLALIRRFLHCNDHKNASGVWLLARSHPDEVAAEKQARLAEC